MRRLGNHIRVGIAVLLAAAGPALVFAAETITYV